MKRAGLLGCLIVAMLAALSTASAVSASAACLRVKPGEVSKFSRRTLGLCRGTAATGGFVKTEGAGVAVAGEPGVECYRVETGEPSGWQDANCTKAGVGVSGWVKVQQPVAVKAGPHWGVEGEPLEGFESLFATNLLPESSGALKLAAETESVECAYASSIGTIVGGSPGQGTAAIALTGCKVFKGKKFSNELKNCTVANVGGVAGKIDANVDTELAYLGTKKAAEEETGALGALITPTSGEKFIALDFSGSECVVSGEVEVKGSVIAQVSSGSAEWGTLTFPASTITKAFAWTGAGSVAEVKAGIKMFGFSAIQSGVVSARLGTEAENPKEAYEAAPS